MIELSILPEITGLTIGAVEAAGVVIGAANDALRGYADETARRIAGTDESAGDARRAAVRQLLRGGGFKPAGRNKPAQEYLLRTARNDGRLPAIFNVVDLINAVSLDSGLPISLVSIDRVGTRLVFRHGRPDERFVFNQSGQELNVTGLICICQGDAAASTAVGSPVKDSMAAKVVENDQHILACIYAPLGSVEADELRGWTDRLRQGFTDWCSATQCESWLLPSPDA